jgi:WWE domain-containing protein
MNSDVRFQYDASGIPGVSGFSSMIANNLTHVQGKRTDYKAHVWEYRNYRTGGWDKYDPEASESVDQAFQAYLMDPKCMDVRSVHSGDWEYQVDFQNMKQTNISHGKHRVREIRRVPTTLPSIKEEHDLVFEEENASTNNPTVN